MPVGGFTVEEYARAPVVRARYRGWCARCGLPIHPGNEVTRAMGKTRSRSEWMHARHLPQHRDYDPDCVVTLTRGGVKGLRDRDFVAPTNPGDE